LGGERESCSPRPQTADALDTAMVLLASDAELIATSDVSDVSTLAVA
jgi:hypothetical protein